MYDSTPTWPHVSGNCQFCLWVPGGQVFFHLGQASPGHPQAAHVPRVRAPGRPTSLPCPCTCAIQLGITGLRRPPAFPLCLLHLRHIEVSLPGQRAHEIDLVLLVDLQPRVGTQLPLLPERDRRRSEPGTQSPPSSQPHTRGTVVQGPRSPWDNTLDKCSESPGACHCES